MDILFRLWYNITSLDGKKIISRKNARKREIVKEKTKIGVRFNKKRRINKKENGTRILEFSANLETAIIKRRCRIRII